MNLLLTYFYLLTVYYCCNIFVKNIALKLHILIVFVFVAAVCGIA